MATTAIYWVSGKRFILSGLSGAGSYISSSSPPDNPDSNWITHQSEGAAYLWHGFSVPPNSPSQGTLLQKFRFYVRKSGTGGNAVDYRIDLGQNGVLKESGIGTGTITSATGELKELSWTFLNDWTNLDGSQVEFAIQQTGGGSGNPASRRYLEIGASEWVVDHAALPASFPPFLNRTYHHLLMR